MTEKKGSARRGPRTVQFDVEQQREVDDMVEALCNLPEYRDAARVTPKSQRPRMADRIVLQLGVRAARERVGQGTYDE